jgi:bacterioferritin
MARPADFGLQQLAAVSLHESDHERQHARAHPAHPVSGRHDLSKRQPLNVGKTVPEMLHSDLQLEYPSLAH